MKFLIQNTTSEDKFITRFGGYKICIPKYDFIEFDSDDALECKYWSNLICNPIAGLNVITDTARIRLLNKLKSCGKYGNSNINVPQKVEPVINIVKKDNAEVLLSDTDIVTKQTVESTVETLPTTEPEIVEDTMEEEITTEEEVTVDDTTTAESVIEEVTVHDNALFTEEELTTKTREELFAILDAYGIKYKKNYSVSKLTNIILENCK